MGKKKHGSESDEDAYEQLPDDKPVRPPKSVDGARSLKSPKANPKHGKVESERPLPPTPADDRPLISLATELTLLNSSIKNDPKIKWCEGDECKKQVEVICIKCQHIFCYRCSRTTCSGVKGSKHAVNDFAEYLAERKQRYTTWMANHRNRCINLDHEIRQISVEVKEVGQELAESPLASISTYTRKAVTAISDRLQNLKNMQSELKETEEVVMKYDTHATKLSDKAFAELAGDLEVSDDLCRCKKFFLCTPDSLTTNACDQVTAAMDRKSVLTATSSRLELFDSTCNHSIMKMNIGGRVRGLQIYKNSLYVALEVTGEEENKVVQFDQLLAKKSHWSTSVNVCDLAINNEKVYLANTDENMSARLHVYTTYGRYLYKIEEGAGTRLVSLQQPNILIVTNQLKNKVHALNGESREILWSVDIEQPWGAAVDEMETIWVWSEHHQRLFLFDANGNRKQEVKHATLAKLSEVNSIGVCNGRLWMAFEEGMYRFQIGYD